MASMTPLHYACNKGHLAVVEILIKYGADLFKRSESYETPLDVTRSKQIKNLLKKEMKLRESQNSSSPAKKMIVNGEDRSMPRGQKSRSAKDLYQAFKAKVTVEPKPKKKKSKKDLQSGEHTEAARDATMKVSESTADTRPVQDTTRLYTKHAKRSISANSLSHAESFLDSPRAKSEDHNNELKEGLDEEHEKIDQSPPTYMAIQGDSPVISPINSHESPDSSEEEKLEWTIKLTGDQFQYKQLVKFMNVVTGSEVFSSEIKVPGLSTSHHWIRVPTEHRKVFVKTFKNLKPEITDVALERILKLKQLKHKYLLDILAYSEEPLTVISEFMKNDLHNVIHQDKTALTSRQKHQIALQVAKGMHFLHANGSTHFGLTPSNILLDANFNVKISDARLSKYELQHEFISMDAVRYLSSSFMEGIVSDKADIYSFGIILWELCAGQLPFDDQAAQTPIQLALKIMSGTRPKKIPNCNADLWRLIERCWDQNPSKRPSFADILQILKKETHVIFLADIPGDIVCPITMEIMKEPVVSTSGYSFEKSAIERHLSTSQFDPITRVACQMADLRPNHALKRRIEEFLKNNPNL
eukprot:TRINITY_DN1160_c0_g1_i1.p1 TRINITY_DN1160_c0_g1~~TRINITY_DN1160_c0_g1_i1.p1  ORF type:complete len:585 (-),score=142.08 TRINITY_DN1160_c0_g1_i1:52-1806(-)